MQEDGIDRSIDHFGKQKKKELIEHLMNRNEQGI
jgi:hypothetical protein